MADAERLLHFELLDVEKRVGLIPDFGGSKVDGL